MSQTTRCPACATMFKVVADQLRVAQGWVRCGQCGEVFDASQHGVPGNAGMAEALASGGQHATDQTALPPLPLADHAVGSPPESMGMPAGVDFLAPDHSEPTLDVRARGGDLAGDGAKAALIWPAVQPQSRGVSPPPLAVEKPTIQTHPTGSEPIAALAGSDERQDPVFTADSLNFKPFNSTLQATGPERQASSAQHDSDAFPKVAFVREAQHNVFWKSPLVRSVLGVICLVLALALMLQWVVRQKDVLAAQAPRLAPLLQAMCRPLGCQVRPLRRLESLLIENSSFSRTGPETYRLRFTFTNTGNVDLEIPALEVTLIDNQDQAVVRRVVMPAEFGATGTTLAAYSNLPGALTLKVASAGRQEDTYPMQAGFLSVAGYRILAFYP